MNEFHHAGAVTRGRIVRVDDAGDHQRIEVRGFAGELFTDVVRAQPHGFTSNPPVDAVGHFLRMGESDRLFALGFETPGRPRSIPAGGKALYDSSGKVLKFLPGDGVDLDAAGQTVTIRNASVVKIEGTASVSMGVGSMWVNVTGGRVDLAASAAGGAAPVRMMTESGPSNVIWGRV